MAPSEQQAFSSAFNFSIQIPQNFRKRDKQSQRCSTRDKKRNVPRFHWLLSTFSRMKTGYFDRGSSIRRVSSTKESFRNREHDNAEGCCEAVKGTVLDTGKTCLLLWRIIRDIVFHFTFMYISGSRCLIQCRDEALVSSNLFEF